MGSSLHQKPTGILVVGEVAGLASTIATRFGALPFTGLTSFRLIGRSPWQVLG
jgi:hypothetical protein